MRTRKRILMWVCGAVLCCAVPAALCQALSGSLAAGTGLSGECTAGRNGMGSISPRSEVSANASFTATGCPGECGCRNVTGATNGGGAGGERGGQTPTMISESAHPRIQHQGWPIGFRSLERGLPGNRHLGSGRKSVSALHRRPMCDRGTMQPEQGRSGR